MTRPMIEVSVVWATPALQDAVPLRLPEGSTIGDAIDRSRLVQTYALDVTQLTVGVYGKRRTADALVHDGDRIELYRPLQCDPKEARRRRARAGRLDGRASSPPTPVTD